jgi:hypothetical protein
MKEDEIIVQVQEINQQWLFLLLLQDPNAIAPFDIDTGYNATQANQFQYMKALITRLFTVCGR